MNNIDGKMQVMLTWNEEESEDFETICFHEDSPKYPSLPYMWPFK